MFKIHGIHLVILTFLYAFFRDTYASIMSMGENDNFINFLAPSRLLNLSWDGLIKKGCPADFIILYAESWADIFSGNLKEMFL